jgi:peptidoglycan/LPS O-acetylase OafA/YrhL
MSGRNLSFDILKTIACILVILHHAGFKLVVLPDYFYNTRIHIEFFFGISAFIASCKLLGDYNKGPENLKLGKFVFMRLAKLYPPLFIAVLLLFHLEPEVLDFEFFFRMLTLTDGKFVYWYLAVDFHFFALILPSILRILHDISGTMKYFPHCFVILVLFGIFLRTLMFAYSKKKHYDIFLSVYMSPATHLDSLCFGSVLGWFYVYKKGMFDLFFKSPKFVIFNVIFLPILNYGHYYTESVPFEPENSLHKFFTLVLNFPVRAFAVSLVLGLFADIKSFTGIFKIFVPVAKLSYPTYCVYLFHAHFLNLILREFPVEDFTEYKKLIFVAYIVVTFVFSAVVTFLNEIVTDFFLRKLMDRTTTSADQV